MSERTRSMLVVSVMVLALLGLWGCDDGGDDGGGGDTGLPTDMGGGDLEPDDLSDTTSGDVDAPGGDVDATGDATADGVDGGDAGDMTALWTDPARFSLVYSPELREIVHMIGADTITVPQVQVRAESLASMPIPGQTVAIDSATPGNRINPPSAVTDEQGLTSLVELTLGGDMDGADARHRLTPHFVGNEPDELRNQIEVETVGVDLVLAPPVDGTGDPVAPLADGGASTWTLSLTLSRNDTTDPTPLPDNLEVGLQFITNQGTPALAFAGDTETTTKRWAVDPADPTVEVELVSTVTEPGQARLFVQLFQLDGSRGQRLEMIDVVAVP